MVFQGVAQGEGRVTGSGRWVLLHLIVTLKRVLRVELASGGIFELTVL